MNHESDDRGEHPLPHLTPQQKRIAQYLATHDCTEAVAADRLGKSLSTLKKHLACMRSRFGAESTRGLIIRLIAAGLIDGPTEP